MSDTDADAGALEDALARARGFVDDRFGVVRQVVVHEIGPSDPSLFFSTAQLASTQSFSDAAANTLNGGAGTRADTAMMGALGEAIERYAIGIYRESELIRGSFRELEAVALDPGRLVFFADEQYAWPDFPYARFDASEPLSWIAGTSLLDGGERLVPAARVYTPYRAPRREERLLQSTSTGAACHVDATRATIAALYEVIERDAVMIAWLNRLPLAALDVESIDDTEFATASTRCHAAGLDVRLFDATSDVGVPTVFSVLRNRPGVVPALAVGAASRPSLAGAAAKALIESAHTLFWIRTRCRDGGLRAFREDYADVTSLDLHSLLYGHPRMESKLAFLGGESAPRRTRTAEKCREPVVEQPADAPQDELRGCASALRHVGADAVVVDVTPRDVADAGFVVVRVVVSDLHPLWGGHHVRCLGGRRVAEVPVTLGFRTEPATASALNPDPHPMP